MHAEAQNRYPIQPTSCWKVDSVSATWNIVENTRYFIEGDTSIGSTKFFKLYKSGVALYDNPFCYNHVYVGALRDGDNRIFFIRKNKTIESTLFDFNLKVGDIQKDEYTYNVKLYYINNNTYSSDKVCISHTVFDTVALGHLDKGVYRINCTVNRIRNNGTIDTVFNEKTINRNYFVTEANYMPSTKLKVPNISVYPNPARDRVTIKFIDGPAGFSSYELYDIQGKKLICASFNISAGSAAFDIDTKAIPAGIYLLKINGKDSYLTHKI